MTMISRPTLRDVARAAGVSVTQTSRALNDHDDVAAATRAMVLDVAEQMGYSPNLEARRLKMPETRTNSIGVVLSTASQRLSDPFFGELLTALVDRAAKEGYELQLSAPLPDEDPTASYQRAVRAKRVDGFVVLRTATDDPRVQFLRHNAVPFVTFGRVDSVLDHPAVNESVDCMRDAVDHLVELGHRRIGCLAEPLGFAIAARRYESFCSALGHHGLRADSALNVPSGFREDEAAEATGRLLDAADPPTALVAFNDLLAIGALKAAADRGVEVPRDLSVIGFDDVHAASLTTPPLTTMRHSAQDVGRHLISQLVAVVEGLDVPPDVYIESELVVRESTGPAPSDTFARTAHASTK